MKKPISFIYYLIFGICDIWVVVSFLAIRSINENGGSARYPNRSPFYTVTLFAALALGFLLSTKFLGDPEDRELKELISTHFWGTICTAILGTVLIIAAFWVIMALAGIVAQVR